MLTLPRPIVSPMVPEAVAELAAAGYAATPADIVWLHELAEKCLRPTPLAPHEALALPVHVGPVRLERLTVGAWLWFQEVGASWLLEHGPWWRGADEWAALSMGWLLAHARDPDTLRRLRDWREARAEVLRWAGRIPVTAAELADGVNLALGMDRSAAVTVEDGRTERGGRDGRAPALDYGDLLALLEATFHQPARHWLWEVSEEELTARVREAGRIIARQASALGGGGISDVTPAERALWEFRQAVAHLKAQRASAAPA